MVRKISAITFCCLLLSSIAAILFTKQRLGVDFAGGTIIEFRMAKPISGESTVNIATVRDTLKPLLSHTSFVLQDMSNGRFTLRTGHSLENAQDQAPANAEAFVSNLKSKMIGALGEMQFEQIESIGPQVSSDLVKQAFTGLLCSCVAILLYMSMRFHWRFALSGVIVLFLDVFITYGFMRIMRAEINLTLVAAFLTIIGYCINDTVVIYDRIRLNFQKYQSIKVSEIISRSVREMMRRSVITSFVTLLAVMSIMFFSDSAIRNFALATSFGIVIGTIGSIFIAPSLLMLLKVQRPREKQQVIDPMFYAL